MGGVKVLCRHTDRHRNRQTEQHLYAPNLLMQGVKRIKCQIPAFPPFPTIFSKAFNKGLFQKRESIGYKRKPT